MATVTSLASHQTAKSYGKDSVVRRPRPYFAVSDRISLTRWHDFLRLDPKVHPTTLSRRIFPARFFVSSAGAQSQNQRGGKRKPEPMIPLLQLNRKPKYLFIALLLASFAVAQSARAVIPEPEGGNPDGNMTVEETADLDVSSGEANAATGQQANENHPNRRTFGFNFRDPRQCAGGDVTMGGELVVTFQIDVRRTLIRVKPKFVAVKGFSATARSGNA